MNIIEMLHVTPLAYGPDFLDTCRFQKYIKDYICSLGTIPVMLILCSIAYYYLSYVILLFIGITTQLYFTWRGNRYEPGDSMLITDVGVHDGDTGPGDSLACVTTDVNTQCCTDVGSVGEWFLPNGSMIPRNDTVSQIVRTGYATEVRLNFRTHQTSPTGEYTCVVPETSGSVIQTAGIRLVSGRF